MFIETYFKEGNIAEIQQVVVEDKGKFRTFIGSPFFKIIVILIILGVLAFLWYKYVGILIIHTNEPGTKINLDVESRTMKGKTKLFIVRPDTYLLNASKDNFKEYQDFIPIRAFMINKVEITLSKSFYVGITSEGDDLGSSFLEKCDDNSMIFYSSTDRSFHKTKTDKTNFVIGNDNSEKIDVDLGIGEEDTMQNVRYSPSKHQALIFYTAGEDAVVKHVNFENNQVKTINTGLTSGDWLNDTEILGITGGDAPKIVKISTGSFGQQNLLDLQSDVIWGQIYTGDGFAIATSSDGAYNLNIDSKNFNKISNIEGLVTSAKISTDRVKVIVQTIKDEKNKTYLINSGNAEDLKIETYLDSITFSADNQNILYASFNKNDLSYVFKNYKLADKTNTVLDSFSQSEGDPSDLVPNGDFLNYVLNGGIMGLKIK